jgi:heme-degrading monooxygenase HmoA
MTRIVLTARVKDGSKWEKAYRSHGDLFRGAGLGTMHYTVSDKDRVVIYTDVDDLDAYMKFMASDETRAAMKNDGVKRKSVKLFVLDKEFSG